MFVTLKGKIFNAPIKSLAAYDDKNIHQSDDLSVRFFLLACGNNTISLKNSAKLKKKMIYITMPFM